MQAKTYLSASMQFEQKQRGRGSRGQYHKIWTWGKKSHSRNYITHFHSFIFLSCQILKNKHCWHIKSLGYKLIWLMQRAPSAFCWDNFVMTISQYFTYQAQAGPAEASLFYRIFALAQITFIDFYHTHHITELDCSGTKSFLVNPVKPFSILQHKLLICALHNVLQSLLELVPL